MSKFTPGPWERIVEKDGSVVVYEATTLQNIDICTMGGNTNDGSNARLIAAAPDLLDALHSMASSFHDVEWMGEHKQASAEMARAAIAKEEGRA